MLGEAGDQGAYAREPRVVAGTLPSALPAGWRRAMQQTRSVLVALAIAAGLLGGLLHVWESPAQGERGATRPARLEALLGHAAPAPHGVNGAMPGAVSAADAGPLFAGRNTPDTGRLTILDVADPAHPVVLGDGLPVSGLVQRVVVSGGYAYVVEHRDGLRIVDLTDITAPRVIGESRTPAQATDVAVVGQRAYVAGGKDGLHILDVADPAHPAALGSWQTGDAAMAVMVAGRYAYVAAGAGGLSIVDVADPTAPYEVSRYRTNGFSWGVGLVVPYAYVTA